MAAAGSSEQHAAEPMAVDAGRAADGGGQRERTAQQQQQQPPQPPRKKKEKATERAYTLDELRTGLRLMIKRNVSQVGAAVQIGHPSAASTLGRYAKRLRRDGELLRDTPRETEAARLEAIDAYMYRVCLYRPYILRQMRGGSGAGQRGGRAGPRHGRAGPRRAGRAARSPRAHEPAGAE